MNFNFQNFDNAGVRLLHVIITCCRRARHHEDPSASLSEDARITTELSASADDSSMIADCSSMMIRQLLATAESVSSISWTRGSSPVKIRFWSLFSRNRKAIKVYI